MKIVIDHREMRSGVAEALRKLGADIEITALEVGDYAVSDRVAFERKTVDDIFATYGLSKVVQAAHPGNRR